jgi:hypothetical protein
MSKIRHMQSIDLATILMWVSLVLPICAIAYKCLSIVAVRRQTNLYFPLRIISFYSDEQIASTSSHNKRDHMKAYNTATVIIYACLVPNLVLNVVPFVLKLKMLLGNIF